jgi:rfaE bifunctional protein kinase chain/domain
MDKNNITKKALTVNTQKIVLDIRVSAGENKKIVFVSGNFNIVHPGHLRLLNYASEVGDYLVVGVHKDGHDGVFIPVETRIAGVQAISRVNKAIVLQESPEEFITALQPDIVVKGKEHESNNNAEQESILNYGGKLLFSSGESKFSSMDLLQRELLEFNYATIRKPTEYITRHDIQTKKLELLVKRFSDLRVVVIGDLIVDEYVTCDPLGMSQEDPTIVVTPIKNDMFVGGAGIVAAHARGMNACVDFFSVTGNDNAADFAERSLKEYGVNTNLIRDENRITTLKQRYRARGKTLLRVNKLTNQDISRTQANELLNRLNSVVSKANLLIFADFNYGCLPQYLVDAISEICRLHKVSMVADSQSSSQVGNVSRFKNMLLITPTEHEARLATRDSGSGLVVLAEILRKTAKAKHIFITLGEEGLLIHSPEDMNNEICTDQLSALNKAPKDVSGAGDCMLTCSALTLIAGGTVWQAAYLGSIAAACQVGRIGNKPLMASEVISELKI